MSKNLNKLSQSIINRVVLTDADRLKIESLQNAYAEAVKLNKTLSLTQYPLIQPINSTLELFRAPLYISSMRLITYFKQIPEFQQLDQTEQISLVKLNTLIITFLHSIFIYDKNKKIYHENNTNDPIFIEKDWINTINKEFHNEMKQIQNNFLYLIKYDDKLIKIIFLIILFSNNFISTYSNINLNTLNIFHAQNIYNELFFKYYLNHYDLYKSSKLFLNFTINIMKIQKLIIQLKYIINDYMDVTKISPLMQSLL